MLNMEELILNHCAPTLAGVKASNMFSIRHLNKSYKEQYKEIIFWKFKLYTKGLSLKILNYNPKSSAFLILIYRYKALKESLFCDIKLSCLNEFGYDIKGNLESLIDELSVRIKNNFEFPHEVGFFLDYPTVDVLGFIEHKGANYTFNGIWKAYGDYDIAKKRYEEIRRCTEKYWEKYETGKGVMQLILI